MEAPIKVAYCIPCNKIGGAEIVFNSIISNSSTDIFIVKIDLGISRNNPILYFKAIINLISIIKKEKIEFVISSLWKSHLICIIAGIYCNFRLIPFIHSTKWFNLMDEIFSKYALKNSFAVIADSSSTSDSIRDFVPHNNIHVVSMRTCSSIPRVRYTGYSSNLQFIFIGRLSESKRLDKALKFLSVLARRISPKTISFHIYGPIEKKFVKKWDEMKSLCETVSISYKGILVNTNVANTLSRYDFYIQLSEVEGMAMSVMEAMQVGLIPIVTNVGEINNYAIDNHNAIVSKNGEDIESLIEKALLVIQDYKVADIISINSYNTFKDTPRFSEDILRVLKIIIECAG